MRTDTGRKNDNLTLEKRKMEREVCKNHGNKRQIILVIKTLGTAKGLIFQAHATLHNQKYA